MALAGETLARDREPRASRTAAQAEAMARRRALRGRAVLRFRPRDQRAPRRGRVDRPSVAGAVRQPPGRSADPEAAEAARRQGDVLRPGGDGAALSGGAEARRGRGARGSDPRLDPRAKLRVAEESGARAAEP